jgi:hypothetical protein
LRMKHLSSYLQRMLEKLKTRVLVNSD